MIVKNKRSDTKKDVVAISLKSEPENSSEIISVKIFDSNFNAGAVDMRHVGLALRSGLRADVNWALNVL